MADPGDSVQLVIGGVARLAGFVAGPDNAATVVVGANEYYGPDVPAGEVAFNPAPVPFGGGPAYGWAKTPEQQLQDITNTANATAAVNASSEAALDGTVRPLGAQSGKFGDWDGDQERVFGVTYTGVRTTRGASGGGKLTTYFEFASKVPILQVRLEVFDGIPLSGEYLSCQVLRKKIADATFLGFELVGGGDSSFPENSAQQGQSVPQTIIINLGNGDDVGTAFAANWPCTMQIKITTNSRVPITERFGVVQWSTNKV